MIKVAFKTLGCRLNRNDSDNLAHKLEERGFQVVNEMPADFVVVNTCTVTNVADRKSRQTVRNFKKAYPHTKVVVMGCGTQVQYDRYNGMEESDHVIKKPEEIIPILESYSKEELHYVTGNSLDPSMKRKVKVDRQRTRALVKVQNGCNEFCTYCIVPFTRGRSVDVSVQDIIQDIHVKEAEGMKEIVITGINIGDYGIKDKKSGLPQLLQTILKETTIPRVRLSSLNPNYFDEEFYEVLKDPRLCRHIHLSLQSGSDAVLEKMRRQYDQKTVYDVVKNLYKICPDMAITGDAIMGFPGETEEDFETTYKVAQDINFAHLHVFPFSPKTGTAATRFKEQLEPPVKIERARKMRELAEQMQKKFIEKQYHSTGTVLWEAEDDAGFVNGLTDNYLRVELPAAQASGVNEVQEIKIMPEMVVGVG